MTDVRRVYRVDQDLAPIAGDGAPHGNSKESITARNSLGEYLDAVLMRPLWFDEAQQMQRVAQSLHTMTLSERIALEIEMTERTTVSHSYDYDALR